MKTTVSLVLEDHILAALDREAESRSCSRSAIARVALASFLNTRPDSGRAGQAGGGGAFIGQRTADPVIIERNPNGAPHIAAEETQATAYELADRRNLRFATWGSPRAIAAQTPPIDATALETQSLSVFQAIAGAHAWQTQCPPQIVEFVQRIVK